ncbi:MAG: mechanosensitive ion channel family protein [Gammaproteobacteria bacterium]
MVISDISTWVQELPQDRIWMVKVFVIVFTTLLLDFIHKYLLRLLQKKTATTASLWDDALMSALIGPTSVLIWVIGITFAADVFDFPYSAMVRELVIILIVAWVIVKFITFVEKNIITSAEASGKLVDKTTAHAVTQLLRISVVISAVLVILQTMGINISAVLAFGGIGGIAVGFAAKDLLANFFGGLMIYLDRPFSVGDWIRSPDQNIEGTVENIGWRLTRIRTFDKRPLYIPNSTFARISVENPSRMTNRRIYETIGLRYDDIQKLDGVIADVTQMLQTHEDIDQSQTLMVNFNSFGASSVDFFVYTFTRTTNWVAFHQIKQDVLLRIAAIIAQHGAEIAFPTRTLHIESEAPAGAKG